MKQVVQRILEALSEFEEKDGWQGSPSDIAERRWVLETLHRLGYTIQRKKL